MSAEHEKPNGTTAEPTAEAAPAPVVAAAPAPAAVPEGAMAPGPSPSRPAGADVRLDKIESLVEGLSKQIAFLPPQIRQLSSKVDGVATSISEPRQRALLLGLLSIYDLVDQMLRAAQGGDAASPHARNYEVLRVQLRQLLDANGLQEIAALGRFDPQVHRALGRVPVTDPQQHEQIVEVVRSGFRTEHAVLRYAEVSVGHHAGGGAPAASPSTSP